MAVSSDSHWSTFIALEQAEKDEEIPVSVENANPACPVLMLQLFAQQPTLDYGTVAVGSRRTLYMKAENPTLLNQHLAAEKLPVQDGFSLSEDPTLPGAASLNWSSTVAPHSSILLPVTWQPSTAGAMSKLLTFKLDGKHRLQVKLLGKAVVEVRQSKQLGDQALRQSVRRTGSGIDAPAEPAPRLIAAKAAAKPTNGHTRSQQRPEAVAAAVPKPPTAGTAAAPTAAARPATQASFKVPPRPAAKSMFGLRLKAPSAATTRPAAGTAAAAAAPTAPPSARISAANGDAARPATVSGTAARTVRPTSAGLEASRSEALLSPGSPPGSLSGGQLIAEYSSPAMLGGSVRSFSTSSRPPGKGPVNRSGRPLSGSSSGGSARKVPSSARKTFKFFHTELWMNKQDRAFTGWLNHLLLPYTPEYLRAASEGDTSAALSDLRLAAQVQGAMLSCYRNDEGLRETMMKVESAIDAGKLRMKPEVVLFGDLVQRRQALDVLLGYNPFWLTLAVEVVTHKPFRPQDEAAASGPGTPGIKRQHTYTDAMKSFLMREVLSDPDMVVDLEVGRGAAHFNKDGYLRDLGAVISKRFLLLVLLLDQAAVNLSGSLRTPLLFKLDAPVKESSKVAFEFLHGRLVGEGVILKHLQHLGYKLAYTQSPLMEYPFAVTNLAVDLRDGLRLIKVAEALTGDTALLSKARYPADRRPMQVHNTGLALSALKEAGVPLSALPTTCGIVSVKPDDIVDGDREKTLSLLWAVARTLQLAAVLKFTTLRAEVQRILARVRQLGVCPLITAVAGLEGRQHLPGQQQALLQVYLQDELLNALMEWVQAVCRSYGVAVHNFTSCFADGVVLCLLVHYYLPNAIDLTGIYLTKQRRQELTGNSRRVTDDLADAADQAASEAGTNLGVQSLYSRNGGASQVWGAATGAPESVANGSTISTPWARSWRGDIDISEFMDDPALEDSKGIAGNYKAVHRAAKALGAVPEMLSSKDYAEHGPDERAVILYVAFLCSRLLDCSKDDRAAHIIQRAWHQYRSKTAGMARAHLNSWVAAATIIQSNVRAWLLRRHLQQLLQKYREAARVLQSCWRGRLVRLQQKQKAAVVIQRRWRELLAQRQTRQQQAAVIIQKYWRVYKLRKADAQLGDLLDRCLQACKALKETRKERRLALAKLQATWRMVLARRQLLAAKAAAIQIQATWRGHQQRLRYQQQRDAAVAIQSAWHGHQQRQQYLRTREAAISLQAAYQGLKVRTSIKQSHAFAVFLQSCCRCRRDRAAFLQLRQSTVVLQAGVRGWQVRQRQRQLEQACVLVQAVWRGRAVRKQLQQQRRAATMIQAAWRGSSARLAYKKQQAAAVRIQAAWRCFAEWQAYQQQRGAAVALQSLVRGRQTRHHLQQMSMAVTVIAAAWRCKAAVRQYGQDVGHIVQVQALTRGCLARQTYQQLHAAAVMLQSAYRGWSVRQQIQQQHIAATVIQSCWRAHSQQQVYSSILAAATALQAAVRGQQACARVTSLRAAAVQLQNSWRARQSRIQLSRHKAAARIQAHWRRYCAQQQLQQAVAAAILIQSCWRSHKQQLWRAEAVAAAVAMQSAVRGHQAQSRHQAVKSAAAVLQRSWRCWQSRQQLLQHRAARAIQCCWRQCRAMQQLQRHRAARTVQCYWRRYNAQQQLEQHLAARSIQCAWRRHKAQQQLQHLQEHKAATSIQCGWRRHKAQHHLRRHKAARTIQCHWKRCKAVQQLRMAVQAATAIQKLYKGRLAYNRYQQMLAAAVTLQAMIRGRAAATALQAQQQAALTLQSSCRAYAARKLLQQHRAAACIQAHVRGWLWRRELAQQAAACTLIRAAWLCHQQRQQYLALQQSAVVLQSGLRGAIVRKQLRRQRAAAVVIQASWKGRLCRQQIAQQHAAATAVQAAYRGYRQRQQYLQQVAAATALQAVIRGHQVQQQLAASHAAAARLQAVYRGWKTRQQLQQQVAAATSIQAAWRCHVQQQRYLHTLQAVVAVQAAWRRHQAAARYQQLRSAAVALQSVIRGQQTRSLLQLQQLVAAAVTLQSFWRGRVVRREFARRAAAAVVVQRFARGMAGRKRAKAQRDLVRSAQELKNMILMLHTRSRAATTIAATWRGHWQRQKFLPVWQAYQQNKAAVVLQQAWRCRQASTLLCKLREELPQRKARAAWQAVIRAAKAALWQQQLEAAAREAAVLVIQGAVRGWQVRRVTARQIAGIKRLQALWRGYKVRKRCGRASRDARRRIAAAVSAPPRRTIGVRTREALDVLLASKQCSQVITAVAAIEFSTRYSKACCQLMVDSEGVRALLEFMRSCNRSKPHMEMLGHALACLANICRWPDLLPGVLHAPDCIMVLSERLQMFRDTEDIFMATVGILSSLVRSDEGALAVTQSAPAAVKLWEQINLLLQRKMEMERKYIERLEGQKGSDVTAREATRKLVSAATQVDALQQVIQRVDSTATAHGIEVMHHQKKEALPAAEMESQELVPRSAHAVVQPNLWQPKNTIVRGTFRESVATRAGASAAAPGKLVGNSD